MHRAAHLTTVALGLLMACTPSTPASEEIRATNANGSANSLSSFQDLEPRLTIIPSLLAFGPQLPGSTTTLPLELRNDGDTDLQVSARVVSGPFVMNGPTSWGLAPGESDFASISFVPESCGEFHGALRTVFGPGPPGSVPLDGQGISQVSLSPSSYDFGDQRVGSTSTPQTVTITNGNSGPILLAPPSPSAPFTVVGFDSPVTLAAGASTAFSVTFTPAAPGAVSGTISLTSAPCDGTHVLSLRGTGTGPVAQLSPPSLAFDPQRVLTPSQPRTVVLTNTGTASLELRDARPLGPFQVSGLSPGLILPRGTSVSFQVTFTPQAEGAATGGVLLFTNAAIEPIVLSLQGTGIASSLRLDLNQLAFGDQRVGLPSLPRLVTVFNDGSAPLNVSQIIPPDAFTVSGLPLPAISPGGSRTFQVTFQPMGLGSVNDSLTLTSDALAGPTSLPVSGNGVAPMVRLSPVALTFGDQRVGTTGASWTATLTNVGTDSLYLSSAPVSGPFVLQPLGLPRTLARGESLPFQVAFRPVAPDRAQGAITFVNDTNQPAVLPLEGTGTVSRLALEPASLSFGAVPIGGSASLLVRLSNPGTEILHLSTEPLSGPFSMTQLPPSLNAGATTSFLVTFSPTSHGFVGNGALTLYSDAYGTPAVQMPLSGQGVGPRVVLSTDRLVFDPVNVGVSSAPRELNVTNGGETELRVLALSLSGAHPEDFRVPSGVLPLPVQPEATVPLPFVFRPRAVGERSVQATLFTNDPLTPIVGLNLTGPGTSPLLVAAPPAVSFGGVRVGSTSSPQQLTLTNHGSGPLTLSLLTLSGANSASFSLTPLSPPLMLPLTLPPGGSLPLQLTFSPQTLRAYNTTVTIGSDDPAQPAVSLPVSGTGNSPILSLSRMELDFGAQLVGRAARRRTAVLTNTGNARLTLSRLEMSGVQAAQFSLVSPPPLPLQLALLHQGQSRGGSKRPRADRSGRCCVVSAASYL